MKKLLILVTVFALVLGMRLTNTHADSLVDYLGSEVSVLTTVAILGLVLLGMAGIAARKRKLKKKIIEKQMLKF